MGMITNKYLIMLILQSYFFGNHEIPDVNLYLEDGLILSYWLKIGDTEKLTHCLKVKGFKEYHEDPNGEKHLSFVKFLDEDQQEVIFVRVQGNKAISITHYNFEKGTKFADAVRSKLLSLDYFKQSSNENEFLFSIPKMDKCSLSEKTDYQYQSKIIFNDVVIIFLVPTIVVEGEDWSTKIKDLVL